MSYFIKTLSMLLAVAVSVPVMSKNLSKEYVQLSIDVAEELMRKHHFELKKKDLDIDASRAEMKQNKLFENPQVSLSHNVYNRLNGKYFDTGYDGQTAVEIEQPIFIGGQRMEKVRKSNAVVHLARSQREDTERLLTGDLNALFFNLYYVQQKQKVYSKQLESVKKILETYKEQAAKGNVPQMEVYRMQTLDFQLEQEKRELLAEEQQLQHEMQLMTGAVNTLYEPRIDERSVIANLAAPLNMEELLQLADSRPDVAAMAHEEEAGRHEVKLQKAMALPQMAVKAEYDKNGNICHNFWGIGLQLSIPIFNKNQGNIDQARVQHEQMRLNREMKKIEARNEVSKLLAVIATSNKLVCEADSSLTGYSDEMLLQAEAQYMKRNISLLEFLDFYSAYKDTQLALLDAHNHLVQHVVKLNTAVGCRIVKF